MEKLLVQKFGGTSLADAGRIEVVADIIANTISEGHKVAVVLSAMGEETDRLIDLAKSIHAEPNLREYDALVSTGEQISVALMAMALGKRNLKAKSYTAYQLGIKTNKMHGRARIVDVKVEKLIKQLNKNVIPVITGFQGMNEEGDITTLGRGGSDTTGVAIAVALQADECQIYTDVDGVFTTDPRICPKARLLEQVSFDEMLELSSTGAKVLQLRAVEYASKYDMPIRVLSSFSEGTGTVIEEKEDMERPVISGISSPVSDAGIDVDVIVQNISADNTTDFTFTVDQSDASSAEQILQDTSESLGGGSIEVDDDIAKVSVVGRGMRGQSGIASKMFQALADHEINILMITTSEIKISVVIQKDLREKAVNALHDTFQLDKNLDT